MKPTIAEARERLTRVAELIDVNGIRASLEVVYKTHTSLDEEAFEHDLRTLLDALSQAGGVIEPFKHWADCHEHLPDNAIVLQWCFGDRAHFEVLMGDFRLAATFLSSLKGRSSD